MSVRVCLLRSYRGLPVTTQSQVAPQDYMILPYSVSFTGSITSRTDHVYLYICQYSFICLISLPPQVPTKTPKTLCPWFSTVIREQM